MLDTTTRSAGAKRRIRLVLALLAVLVACLIAEAGIRLRGEGYDAALKEREAQELVNGMESVRQRWEARGVQREEEAGPPPALHPYLGYDVLDRGAYIARNCEYFQSEESRRTYDVMVVGGSVSVAFGVHGADTLAELLRSDPRFGDRPVRVLSEGRGGYKQPQQLMLVCYLSSLGFQPDLVLNLDGYNDCALANANLVAGVHPAHPSVAHWAHLASDSYADPSATSLLIEIRALQHEASSLLSRTRSWRVWNSAALGTLALNRLKAVRKQYMRSSQEYVEHLTEQRKALISGPPIPVEKEAARALIPATWFQSSRSIDAACRARGIRYLHVLQPTLTDPGSKPLTEAEIAGAKCFDSWREGVRFGYPRMRELGVELCALGVEFVDASFLFQDVTEPLYYDVCHFDQAGIDMLARRIAEAILAPPAPR